MDAMEQNDYGVFRRDVYRLAVSNESQQSRRIVRSIGDDDDDDDNLESLRLAALRSMGSKNSYANRGFDTAVVGDTRRVSLGREDKSDLQIVTLERQDSLSSSSTDYEEIDLSAPTEVINEDKRTFPDSEDNDSELESDNAESEEKFGSDSPKEEEETLQTVYRYQEDVQEHSVEGYNDSDDNDDVVENNEILSVDDDDDDDDVRSSITNNDDNIDNNDILTDDDDDDDDVGNNIADNDGDIDSNTALTDDEDVQNENDVTDGENESGEDIERNSPNSSEVLADELLDSDNEINILNDISITIANESLTGNVPEETVENEGQESHLMLGHESDGEQVNDENFISLQRIIVSHSDSEHENDITGESKNLIKKPEEQLVIKSKRLKQDKQDTNDSSVTSVTASLETAKTVLLTKEKEKVVQNIKKSPDLNVKPSPIAVKRNSKLSTEEKPEVESTFISKSNKDIKPEKLPKENTVEKPKQPVNEKGKAQKRNRNSSIKDGNSDGKVVAANKTDTKEVNAKNEDGKQMDFDQLSIEDEDSDFVEEEEDFPAVKSKVGLNKLPTERSRTKRSSSRENKYRKRRRSYSSERTCASSRSYRNQSPLRDRLRDQRLRDRSRERFRRRSHSPPSRDRANKGDYSRRERRRSRDRMQNRITSTVAKSRENRRYRSRSRSGSRPRSGRTEKDLRSKVKKQITKDTGKVSVKERLQIKKEGELRTSSRSPRKELRTQDISGNKKTVKVQESKPSTVALGGACNGAEESRPTPIKVAEVKVKQSKGLWRHAMNTYTIQELDISRNHISDLSGLKGLSNLTVLRVENNLIISLDSLGKLRCLQELYLANNRISEVKSFANQFPSLEILDLSHNVIETVEEMFALSGISTLVELTVIENPFETNDTISCHRQISQNITSLEILDKVSLKRPTTGDLHARPPMRPMSASQVVSAKQIEEQIKATLLEQESFEASIASRFSIVKDLFETLPSELKTKSHNRPLSGADMLESVSLSRPSTAGNGRPSSRCSSRSRIAEARAFAAEHFHPRKS